MTFSLGTMPWFNKILGPEPEPPTDGDGGWPRARSFRYDDDPAETIDLRDKYPLCSFPHR